MSTPPDLEDQVRETVTLMLAKLEVHCNPGMDARVLALFSVFAGRYNLNSEQYRYEHLQTDEYIDLIGQYTGYLTDFCIASTNLISYYGLVREKHAWEL